MEATTYVEINEHGSAVIAGTGIHVDAIGYAHEDGTPEQELLEWFSIDQVQLYGALAYFYQNKDELKRKTDSKIREATETGRLETDTLERLRQRKNQSG